MSEILTCGVALKLHLLLGREDPSAEAARNKAFWDEKLAQGVPQPLHDYDARVNKAADAWDKQLRKEEERSGVIRGSNAHKPRETNPRQQFEEGLLKQAQGLWAMLQGKGGEHDCII